MRAYADRLCALALFVGVALTCRWYGGSAAGDDTFIYLRYVGNALAGDGYTFNVGERSFGVTSPLWTWSMTLVAAAFGNALEVYRLASTLLLATAAVAV